jgi:hypothetical protein
VYGGDGITPDYCVEPDTANKVVAHLVSRQAFLLFSRGFNTSETFGQAAQIAGAGSRSEVKNEKVRLITRDFEVDDKTWAEFKALVKGRGIPVVDADMDQNREQIARMIQDEVLRQVFGEGEARRKSMSWDPQVKKALEMAGRSELLLKDPKKFISQKEAETKIASRR